MSPSSLRSAVSICTPYTTLPIKNGNSNSHIHTIYFTLLERHALTHTHTHLDIHVMHNKSNGAALQTPLHLDREIDGAMSRPHMCRGGRVHSRTRIYSHRRRRCRRRQFAVGVRRTWSGAVVYVVGAEQGNKVEDICNGFSPCN